MVSGEQKLFEACVMRGYAIQRMVNLTFLFGESFRGVFSSFEKAAKQFNHFMEVLRG